MRRFSLRTLILGALFAGATLLLLQFLPSWVLQNSFLLSSGATSACYRENDFVVACRNGDILRIETSGALSLLRSGKDDQCYVTAIDIEVDHLFLGFNDGRVSRLQASGEVESLGCHESTITKIKAILPLDIVITAGRDGVLKIWEMHTGVLVRSISAHSHWLMDFEVIDKKDVITASKNGVVSFWSLTTGERISSISFGDAVEVLGLAPIGDGNFAAGLSTGEIAIVNTKGLVSRRRVSGSPIFKLKMLSKDRLMAFFWPNEVQVLTPPSCNVVAKMGFGSNALDVLAVSHDAFIVASSKSIKLYKRVHAEEWYGVFVGVPFMVFFLLLTCLLSSVWHDWRRFRTAQG